MTRERRRMARPALLDYARGALSIIEGQVSIMVAAM
jgi:hypothetical protein